MDNTLDNSFINLVETFKKLRGPNGCPWDKAQTHQSLIKCLREESQEVITAIENFTSFTSFFYNFAITIWTVTGYFFFFRFLFNIFTFWKV